jgi:hypothetical protein
MGPFWSDWDGDGFTPHTEGLIEGLAATARGSNDSTERRR